MKRIFLVVAIALVSCFCIFADTQLNEDIGRITTYIPHYCLVTFKENTSLSTTGGMPFDITESLAGYNATTLAAGTGGWKIATWSLEANMSSFTITFNASPLTCSSDGTALPYYLILKYVENDVDKFFVINVPTSGDATSTGTIPTSGPLVSLDNDVLFMFQSSADVDAAPGGSYAGSVTITLTEGS